jgi:hypothetical protein
MGNTTKVNGTIITLLGRENTLIKEETGMRGSSKVGISMGRGLKYLQMEISMRDNSIKGSFMDKAFILESIILSMWESMLMEREQVMANGLRILMIPTQTLTKGFFKMIRSMVKALTNGYLGTYTKENS